MKKIVSIVISIAMLATSVVGALADSYPSDYDNALLLDSGFDSLNADTKPFFIGGGGAISSEYGKFGKDASDESALMKEGSAAGKYYYLAYSHNEMIYLENGMDYSGNLVIDFNFKAVNDNFNFLQLALSQRQHNISPRVTPTTKGYNNIGWNNVRFVYNPAGHGDLLIPEGEKYPAAGIKVGTTTLYLNGTEIGTNDIITESNQYDYGASEILIQMYSGDSNSVHSAYFDDIKIYKSDFNEAPAAASISNGDTFSISGANIVLSSNTTLNDIFDYAEDCESLMAYADDTLSATVEPGKSLAAGNVVVAKSSSNVYSYYTIAEEGGPSVFLNVKNGTLNGLGIAKFTNSPIYGFGGKTALDASVKLTNVTTAEVSNYDGNCYISYDLAARTKNYFAAEFNFYPEDGDNLFLKTVSHADVVSPATVGKGLEAGKWNKCLMYVDYTGDAPVGHLFINGTEIGNAITTTTFDAGKQLRIGYYTAKTEYITSYIDDIKLYETDTAPTAALTSLSSLVSNDKATIDGNTVKALPGLTVSDLTCLDEGAVIRAYGDSGFTYETNYLVNGGAVVVCGGNGSINYYNVVYDDTSSVIFDANNLQSLNKAVTRGNKESVSGFYGKDEQDESIKLTQNGIIDNDDYTMFFDTSWGTSTSLESWDKSDYVGYLVYEFNVLNSSCRSISIGAEQNTPIARAVTAENLNKNQWNKVSVVFDFSRGENNGKSITYVNGTAIGEPFSASALGSPYNTTRLKNTLRLLFYGIAQNAATEETLDFGTVYIDDIKIYETTSAPNMELPSLPSEYLSSEGNFLANGVTRASDIVTEYTLRAYKDNTFTAMADSEAVLKEGNVVVLEDEYGNMKYYPVTAWDGITVISDTFPTDFVRGSVETVSGFAGKPEEDEIYKVTLLNDEDGSGSTYSNTMWNGVSNAASKYLVADMNVLPVGGKNSSVSVATDRHGELGGRFDTTHGEFYADRWNRYTIVVKLEDFTADIYMNGYLVTENNATAFGPGKSIRNIAYVGEGESMYFDDYVLYESINYPVIETEPAIESGLNATYVASGDVIYTTPGTTADNIAALFDIDENTEYTVYTGIDMITAIAGGDAVSDGAVIMLKKNGENYYYRIIKLIDSIPSPGSNEIVILGTHDNTADERFTVVANLGEKAILVVAQYSDDDSISIKHFKESDGKNLILENVYPSYKNGTIKIFAIDDINSLRPIGKANLLKCSLGLENPDDLPETAE